MRKTIKRCASFLLVLFCLSLSGCQKREAFQEIDFAMGTAITQNFYGKEEEALSEKVMECLKKLEEEKLSWRIASSEVGQINEEARQGKSSPISSQLEDWVNQCVALSKATGGEFDITIGSVARLWDIGGENPKIPDERELKEALKLVDATKIQMTGEKIFLGQSNMQLDLGAVGKGIGCDEIKKIVEQEEGFLGGIFSVGGSNLIVGQKPSKEPWKIGVQDPEGEDGEMALLIEVLKDCNISTSGDYEKYFEEDGKRYHHILSGKTGYPAKTGLHSVTVIADTGLMADGLSTSCFLVGLEEGKKLLEQYGAEGIFIMDDKTVYATEGIRSEVSILKEEYTWGG